MILFLFLSFDIIFTISGTFETVNLRMPRLWQETTYTHYLWQKTISPLLLIKLNDPCHTRNVLWMILTVVEVFVHLRLFGNAFYWLPLGRCYYGGK